ncbi:MAG: Hsp20 family protein [Candidatus Pacebacteria bacterium]|nr:Hsp20 family protein [Candidatus Paceibacterota bacterium]
MDTFKNENIRHYFDPTAGVLYLSIVDVIEILEISTDPRNYWKTTKSRLKINQNKLVTKCNQVKMRASDGKNYLTDATDSDNMLLLIQHIAPDKVGKFRKIFKEIEDKSSPSSPNQETHKSELSTEENDDHELGVDFYENQNIFIIRAMLAGVEKDDISIIANCKNILIKGKRNELKKINEDDYTTQELTWGKFSREINLPEEIEIEEIETNYIHGMLEIKLSKIDKSKTKIIKLK